MPSQWTQTLPLHQLLLWTGIITDSRDFIMYYNKLLSVISGVQVHWRQSQSRCLSSQADTEPGFHRALLDPGPVSFLWEDLGGLEKSFPPC